MSKRILSFVAVAGLLAFATPAMAQDGGITVYFGGGVGSATGDLGDVTDPGFLGVAGLLFPVGGGSISIGGEGFYGSLGGTDVDDSLKLYGAMGIIDVSFGDSDGVSPYVFAGAGLLVGDTDEDSESQFGYEGGIGLALPLGGVSAWVEGRYMGSKDLDLIAFLVGLAIG